jgi:hypothetical protein
MHVNSRLFARITFIKHLSKNPAIAVDDLDIGQVTKDFQDTPFFRRRLEP